MQEFEFVGAPGRCEGRLLMTPELVCPANPTPLPTNRSYHHRRLSLFFFFSYNSQQPNSTPRSIQQLIITMADQFNDDPRQTGTEFRNAFQTAGKLKDASQDEQLQVRLPQHRSGPFSAWLD